MSAFQSSVLGRLSDAMPPCEDAALGKEGFAIRLQALLDLCSSSAPPTVEVEDFVLRYCNGTVFRLDGVFHEFLCIPPPLRDQALLRIADLVRNPMVCTASEDWKEARDSLVPRLVHSAQVHLVRLRRDLGQGDTAETGLFSGHLTEALDVRLAYNTPMAIGLLTREHLHGWGVPPDRALEIAAGNLARLQPDPFVEVEPGVYEATVGDCHDSARLLLIDQIRDLPLRGEPLALPSSRDMLVVTGTEERSGLARMLARAVEATTRAGQLTTQPLVLGEAGWTTWRPPADHRYADAFTELTTTERAGWYEAQREIVERWIAEEDEHRTVSHFVRQALPDGGPVVGVADWPSGPGYLPQADMVRVVTSAGSALVPWHRLGDLAGTWLHRSRFHQPALWRVEGPLPASVADLLAQD